MSQIIKITATVVLFAVAGICLVTLFVWDSEQDAQYRQQECREIAEAAKADFWREKSYNCLIMKDGKVIYDRQ